LRNMIADIPLSTIPRKQIALLSPRSKLTEKTPVVRAGSRQHDLAPLLRTDGVAQMWPNHTE
jgi:hypothetical protein